MSGKTANDKEDDKRSAIELHDEGYLRRDLEKSVSRINNNQDALPQMSQRGKALGKRKREHEEEDVERPAKQPVEQDKEFTVYLKLVTTSAFPDTQHAISGEHGSDVSRWD